MSAEQQPDVTFQVRFKAFKTFSRCRFCASKFKNDTVTEEEAENKERFKKVEEETLRVSADARKL